MLEDGYSSRRASNATGHVQGNTDKEKRPALFLPALLSQRLQVKALADWHAPAAEEDLVHADPPRLGARPRLVGHRVARHSRKLPLPVPPDRLLAGLDAARGPDLAVGQGLPLLEGQVLVGRKPAGADDEDVARLEANGLLLGDRQELVKRDGVRSEMVNGDAVLLGPGPPVQQYATAGDGLFGDVWNTRVRSEDFPSFSPTPSSKHSWTCMNAYCVLRACCSC